MTKRAFLVLGPESSGTRLMTRLLMAAGCAGDDGHAQRWDDGIPQHGPALLVWRRSLPHGDEHLWPNVAALVAALERRAYHVTAVVMSRDWHAMAISQQQNHTGGDADLALSNIQDAYRLIFTALDDVPYELVNYEAITTRPHTLRYLFRRLGLPEPDSGYLYDGNARYYAAEEAMHG